MDRRAAQPRADQEQERWRHRRGLGLMGDTAPRQMPLVQWHISTSILQAFMLPTGNALYRTEPPALNLLGLRKVHRFHSAALLEPLAGASLREAHQYLWRTDGHLRVDPVAVIASGRSADQAQYLRDQAAASGGRPAVP